MSLFPRVSTGRVFGEGPSPKTKALPQRLVKGLSPKTKVLPQRKHNKNHPVQKVFGAPVSYCCIHKSYFCTLLHLNCVRGDTAAAAPTLLPDGIGVRFGQPSDEHAQSPEGSKDGGFFYSDNDATSGAGNTTPSSRRTSSDATAIVYLWISSLGGREGKRKREFWGSRDLAVGQATPCRALCLSDMASDTFTTFRESRNPDGLLRVVAALAFCLAR